MTYDYRTSNEIAVLIARSTFERIEPGNIVTTTYRGEMAGPLAVLAIDVSVLGVYARLQVATAQGAVAVVHLHCAKTDTVNNDDGFVMHLVLG